MFDRLDRVLLNQNVVGVQPLTNKDFEIREGSECLVMRDKGEDGIEIALLDDDNGTPIAFADVHKDSLVALVG